MNRKSTDHKVWISDIPNNFCKQSFENLVTSFGNAQLQWSKYFNINFLTVKFQTANSKLQFVQGFKSFGIQGIQISEEPFCLHSPTTKNKKHLCDKCSKKINTDSCQDQSQRKGLRIKLKSGKQIFIDNHDLQVGDILTIEHVGHSESLIYTPVSQNPRVKPAPSKLVNSKKNIVNSNFESAHNLPRSPQELEVVLKLRQSGPNEQIPFPDKQVQKQLDSQTVMRVPTEIYKQIKRSQKCNRIKVGDLNSTLEDQLGNLNFNQQSRHNHYDEQFMNKQTWEESLLLSIKQADVENQLS